MATASLQSVKKGKEKKSKLNEKANGKKEKDTDRIRMTRGGLEFPLLISDL
ncbi:MAG: hypothetical protein WEB37_03545 [Bacteroidota bacterium]